MMQGRDYVSPEDIKRMAFPTLNHRLIISTEAMFRGVTERDIINDVLKRVAVPI